MPSYMFKCPECKGQIIAVRKRKYAYVRDECNAGPRGRVKVRMKYLRTIKAKRSTGNGGSGG